MTITYNMNGREVRAFGPAAELRPGVVEVSKADGSVEKRSVQKVTKPFDVDGTPHVFGTLRRLAQPSREEEAGLKCRWCLGPMWLKIVGRYSRSKPYCKRQECVRRMEETVARSGCCPDCGRQTCVGSVGAVCPEIA